MFRRRKKTKKNAKDQSNGDTTSNTKAQTGSSKKHIENPNESQSVCATENHAQHQGIKQSQCGINDDMHEIFKLVEDGLWNKVRKKLNSRAGKKISKLKDETELNLLGVALGSRAPNDIVKLIISLNPDSILSKDLYGAMPLHLGCLNGISPDIVQMIFDLDGGQSARIPDKDNRTALHHAVEFACMLSNADDSSILSIAFEESIEIIELLLSVAPETVLFTTLGGHSPLDIPQIIKGRRNLDEHDNLDEIYRLLKEASIKFYKTQKEIWERNGNDKGIKNKDYDSESVPSVMSSQASSMATISKATLYAELEKMSINSFSSRI
jgi:ankyrin repeat protein